MKLGIKGDSLRLRVSRSELARILAGARVEETIHFGPTSEARLTYALESVSGGLGASVRHSATEIAIILSGGQLRSWGETGRVGIYTTVDVGLAVRLELTLEKDFACLDLTDEDGEDTFANPNALEVC
jgi:hypothetical protein